MLGVLTAFVLVAGLLLMIFIPLLKSNKEQSKQYDKQGNQDEEKFPKSESDGRDFERIVDFMMGFAADRLSSSCDLQRLPNLDIVFPMNHWPLTGDYHFSTKNGFVTGLSTLHRDGRASTSWGPRGQLLLDAAAGMRTLHLCYGQYSLKGNWINASGKLEVDISPVTLRMCIALSPPLSPELRSLRVENLGRPKVRASGLGIYGFMSGLWVPYVEGKLEELLKTEVLKQLQRIIDEKFRNYSHHVETLPQVQLFPRRSSEVPWSIDLRSANDRIPNRYPRSDALSRASPTLPDSELDLLLEDVDLLSRQEEQQTVTTEGVVIAATALAVGVGVVAGLAAWALSDSDRSEDTSTRSIRSRRGREN